MDRDLLKFIEEAMELYAKSKWEEAQTTYLESILEHYPDLASISYIETARRFRALQKPEFKP